MEQINIGEILIDFDDNEEGVIVYRLKKAYMEDFEKPENADLHERMIKNATDFHNIIAELLERM